MKEFMGLLSVLSGIAGTVLLWMSWQMIVTVPTEGGEVANFQLLSVQSNMVVAAMGFFVTAAVLGVGAALKD